MTLATLQIDVTREIDDATCPVRRRAPSAPFDPGDRYEVIATIGRGGMGEVMRARDRQIGREVAIKRLYRDAITPTALARFLREARIQGQLEHPAIPAVYEVGFDTAGRPYFVMQKLAGETLAHTLRDPARSRAPRARLLRAFVAVCRAIELAHARGIVHRDLKPSNILVGDHGEVYVLDWGIARRADDPPDTLEPAIDTGGRVTQAGMVLGTPGYMAPEQVTGARDVDARSDVYALGCILFEILAGTPLHPSGRAGMRSAVLGLDGRPSSRGADVPPELDELCRRAITVERETRLASVRELADVIERYLEGDRDVALRERLASEHLTRARAALAVGRDDEHARRRSIREAGRALALAPESQDAASLVGGLLLAPPATTPSGVRLELAALDRTAARRHAWFGLAAHAGYLVLAGLLVVVGVRDRVYIGAVAGVATLGVVIGWRELVRPSRAAMIAQLAAHFGVVALLARMFTPFLVAPGVAAVAVMAFAGHPATARRGVLAAACALAVAAVVGPYLAEVMGAAAPTIEVVAGRIVLASPVAGIGNMPVEIALCLYAVALLVAAAVLAGRVAREYRAARHRIHVQTWHLRQLLADRTCEPAKARR